MIKKSITTRTKEVVAKMDDTDRDEGVARRSLLDDNATGVAVTASAGVVGDVDVFVIAPQ